jgi:hypothetical protein
MWLLSLLLIVACGVIAIGIAAAGMKRHNDDDRATVVPFQRAHERPALRGRSDAVAVHELRLRQSRLEHHTEVDPWNVNGDDDESDPRRGTQADASAGIYRGHGLSGGS